MKLSSETKQEHRIIDETRRSIIDALLAMGSLTGDKEYHEFAKLVCPSLSEGTISEIARHMDRFDDWPESYLLDTVIDYLQLSDECFLLEQYVNPNIHHWRWSAEEERRVPIHNSELVEVINRYLAHDEYQLEIKDSMIRSRAAMTAAFSLRKNMASHWRTPSVHPRPFRIMSTRTARQIRALSANSLNRWMVRQ